MIKCEICSKEFAPKNLKKPSRTCSKECKNKLASKITINQFSDPIAREIQRLKSLEKKADKNYQKNFEIGIQKRTERWEKEGHPRVGLKHPDGTGEKISKANTGRFKGKTWEEIYGSEVAARRRKENSDSMSKKNEILLKERRSNLEDMIVPYLPNYENNKKVSCYTVDFINEQTKHIVEIYGDFWHCNPKIYNNDYIHPHLQISASNKRQQDENRINHLKSLGYDVTIIWESDIKAAIADFKSKYQDNNNEINNREDQSGT